jgi:16S rRNA (uracil1498-N3)-methyltransferase
MHRYRLYVPAEKIAGDAARLDGDEFHHAVNVLRRTQGTIAVFDGVSREWEATIADVKKHHASLHLDRLVREKEAPAVRVLACPALTKGTSFDAVVEAAAELGADVIAPVIAARCAASVQKAGAGTRLERWRCITIAAAKQSGRIALPELRPPVPLDELVPSLAPATTVICTAGSGARPLLQVLESEAAGASAIAVLVGPEADFTPEEVAAAVEAGAHAASLGPTTLRSATATAYALAVVSAYLTSR